MIFNTKSKKGQSLIEAIVALGVLTVGFLGIVSLLSKSLFYGRDVSDTMKATYLASEGIEITKNLIDHDIALALEGNGGGWGACFAGKGGTDFEMDYAATCDNITLYSGKPLLFDSASNLYGYTLSASALTTNFVRKIRVVENGNEITVNSIVTWSTGPIRTQSINIEDQFYNWQSQG
jgi:Tfp pilus assembly protein PilV